MELVNILSALPRDPSIIGESPIVLGECQEPSRIVLRDMGNTYVVHMQVYPVSLLPAGRDWAEVKPFFVQGDYYPKNEVGALARAWDRLHKRYLLLDGRDSRLLQGQSKSVVKRLKVQLHNEITTLSQGEP